jgi:hypothetical protein
MGHLSVHDLPHQYREAEDVNRLIVGLVPQQLWCHISRGARVGVLVFDEPKIADFVIPIIRSQNI